METRTIVVYRNSPAWDRPPHVRWFQLPNLADLYIDTYEVTGDYIGEADMARHAAELRALHGADVVLVY